MFNLINFFFFMFFISTISSIIFIKNFFLLVIFSEFIWITLILLNITTSAFIDELTSFSLTFFIFFFATAELSLGLMILMMLKHLNQQLYISSSKEQKTKKSLLLNIKKSQLFF